MLSYVWTLCTPTIGINSVIRLLHHTHIIYSHTHLITYIHTHMRTHAHTLPHSQGSGSACRSMYDGFVAWNMGERKDGSDSIAVRIAPQTHWPNLRVLILVVTLLSCLSVSLSHMQTHLLCISSSLSLLGSIFHN